MTQTPPLATSLTTTIADAFGFTTPEREHLGGLIREGLAEAAPPIDVRKLAEQFMDTQIKPGVTNLELAKIGSRMAFELTRLPPAVAVPSEAREDERASDHCAIWEAIEKERASLPPVKESEVDTNGLKPCPICKAIPRRNGRANAGGVLCAQSTHRVQTYGRSQEEADAEWNTRATPPAPAQALPAGGYERLINYIFDTANGSDGANPRIIDLCYTSWGIAKEPNPEDGGKSDWFTDTKPRMDEIIASMKNRLFATLSQSTTTEQNQ